MQWSIDNDKIIGSSNPTFFDLKELYSRGYKSIISFLYDDEEPNCGREDTENLGFKIYSIPLKDFCAPDISKIRLFLERLDQSFNRGKVLIHCQGGKGRTGTMAAAYWINKGLSAKEAINKIRRSRNDAIETNKQEHSLYEFESSLKKTNQANIKAVVFDFRGVIVNHKNDEDLISGLEELLINLKANGIHLSIVSSFPVQTVRELIGKLELYFKDNIFSGSGEGKLDKIIEFAQKIGINDMSKIAFIDDKPANLEPVKNNSNIYVIGFKGSGKYYPDVLNSCRELKITFAENVNDLKELLLIKSKK